ncbi:GDSL-type esterase/lipase family protein [Rhodopirellula sallentina]|uniref:SGNH hydrolase-type esterase domain-containing protein n=1 Tax=Rhodopirellula sallentina SM41 TaxID=1263870 RepID=M5UNT6_9BACT|nr:GDSL-type esterase/lipase family protein [Rhodopirellula sallentina]EMI57668.1 hypothetical protein RSSM_00922 [Rhodopirellula sallentina SM41]
MKPAFALFARAGEPARLFHVVFHARFLSASPFGCRLSARIAAGLLVGILGMGGATAQENATSGGQADHGGETKTVVDSPLNATPDELQGIISEEDRQKAIERWEKDIAKFEELDQTQQDPDNAVMLLGSSSIRLWSQAAEMLAPYPIIRRGYGGARYSDMVVFARRLISPHQYRVLVVFIANDITGSEQDRTVDEVEKMVMHVIGVSKKYQPDAPILLVEVTPTPSRWKVWPEVRRLNEMFREVALTQPNVYCLTTAEYYLNADDTPRSELFLKDMLHQNEAGYLIWGDLIGRRLDEILTDEEVQVSAAAGVEGE